MITPKQIKEELQEELLKSDSKIESKMIVAEYNSRIKKLKVEGEKAYLLAYIRPYNTDDDCGCGK
jgi:hypothetical protein